MLPPGSQDQERLEGQAGLSGESRRAQPLRQALGSCRKAFSTAAIFSVFINLLMLVPVVYMLQVYDRVLSSGNETTLWFLSGLAVFLMMVMGVLEWLRSQLLVVASSRLDVLVSPQLHDALFMRAMMSPESQTASPLSDLTQLRQFMTGPGFFAFFDAPWVVIYIAVMYLFHPWIGNAAVIAALILASLALFNEWATRGLVRKSGELSAASNRQTTMHLRNAELVQSMGMVPRLRERWTRLHQAAIQAQHEASRRAGLIAAISRTFRLIMQSLMLGLGAYLALRKDISGGAVLAGSILLGRALAPVDLLIGNWRNVLQARESFGRLNKVLQIFQGAKDPMPLPAPAGHFVLDNLSITPPGLQRPVLKSISLDLPQGSQLAVMGPSASGKSTLLRAMLGLYIPVDGSIRLDGAEVSQRDRVSIGQHMGYLPQDVELLEGSVAENIARFGPPDPQAVVDAAMLAGVHEMILALPKGYDTIIGPGLALSAGQRQRIGLARAVFGKPRVVILDEPNSNLDEAGDVALSHALEALRKLGSTVIVVTHRRNLVQQVDRILLLFEGRLALYGSRDQVNAALQNAARKQVVSGPKATVEEASL
jgi:ATP-binding cassette, subfamily C, bacterial EexD